MENKFERITEPGDPRRCQASVKTQQCPYVRVEGSEYCPMHSGHVAAQTAEIKSVKMYRLAKWQDRLDELENHDQVKSLRSEIGLLRIMLEEVWNNIKTPTDMLLYASKISDLITKIEKLVSSCHRLENAAGMLLDKTAALQIANVIVSIISDHIDDVDIIDKIATEIVNAIVSAKVTKEGKTSPV